MASKLNQALRELVDASVEYTSAIEDAMKVCPEEVWPDEYERFIEALKSAEAALAEGLPSPDVTSTDLELFLGSS